MRRDCCKYYNGAVGPGMRRRPCGAGVDMRALVGGPDHGWLARLPCTRNMVTSLPKEPGPDCELYEEPTAAEVAEYERETRRAVAAALNGECPTCGKPMSSKRADGL